MSGVRCVCFFKQKTAYELRISDWSSDVCSSDLDQEARPARRGRERAPPACVEHEEEPEDEEEQLAGMEQTIREQRQIGRRAVVEEIGRASFRERVCQYV